MCDAHADWACTCCTLFNVEGTTHCSACGAERGSTAHSNMWECSECTFHNKEGVTRCAMCDCSRPSELPARNQRMKLEDALFQPQTQTSKAAHDEQPLPSDITLRAYLAWCSNRDPGGGENPLVLHLNSRYQTVADAKQAIFEQTKVPTVVQRLVIAGNPLNNSGATLASCGLIPGKVHEIAVLFPQRSESSPIEVKDAKMTILTLKAGEWSISSSITTLRQNVAAALKEKVPGNVKLVFNGLTLQDSTTFGQNGIHGNSSIYCFTK